MKRTILFAVLLSLLVALPLWIRFIPTNHYRASFYCPNCYEVYSIFVRKGHVETAPRCTYCGVTRMEYEHEKKRAREKEIDQEFDKRFELKEVEPPDIRIIPRPKKGMSV